MRLFSKFHTKCSQPNCISGFFFFLMCSGMDGGTGVTPAYRVPVLYRNVSVFADVGEHVIRTSVSWTLILLAK